MSMLVVLFVLVAGASLDVLAQGNSRWGRSHNRGRHLGWTRGRRVGQNRNNDYWRLRRRTLRRDMRWDRRDIRSDRRELRRDRRDRRDERRSFYHNDRSAFEMRQRQERAALRMQQHAQREQFRAQYKGGRGRGRH